VSDWHPGCEFHEGSERHYRSIGSRIYDCNRFASLVLFNASTVGLAGGVHMLGWAAKYRKLLRKFARLRCIERYIR